MQNHESGTSTTTEFLLSNVEAVLAGTLALMTAMAQGCCEEHRRAIRLKVIANLAELEQHENVSGQFRAVASHLQKHWYRLDNDPAQTGKAEAHLWHASPGVVQ